jgi:hypothetical protein
MKKNIVYLTLDDLKKLYDIDPKLIKKIKKKRKRRKKLKKKLGESIKFDKIKEGPMMGVQYFNQPLTRNTSTIDVRDAQLLKEELKAIKDKPNPLMITDIPPNLVNNNEIIKRIEDIDKNLKLGINTLAKEGAEAFNYLFDVYGDITYKNKPIDYEELDRNEKVNNNLTKPIIYDDDISVYTVDTEDNIGDFSNKNMFIDPVKKEEEKQTKNSLSQISGSIEAPLFESDIETNPLFYQEQSEVLEPIEQPVERTTEQTIVQSIVKPIEETIVEENKEITPTDQSFEEEKPIFIPPPRLKNEHKAKYDARTEYQRKLFYGLPVTNYSQKRYGKKENIL